MLLLFAKDPYKITVDVGDIACGVGLNQNITLFVRVPFDATLSASVVVGGYKYFCTSSLPVLYFFTLTGAEDGLDDITIPITSFQCRMRSGDPTYLSVVIPGVDYAGDISDRSNGTLKIDMAYKDVDVILQKETIVSADLEDVAVHRGTSNTSIVLTGYKTETNGGKSIALDSSIYRSVKNGKIRHRIAKPNIYLKPGDTVTIDDDIFVADVVSYAISVSSKTMEVAES